MRHITARGIMQHMLQFAKDDSAGRATGWCSMGKLKCAYYPNSQHHTYFKSPVGVVDTHDAEEWLSAQLGVELTREKS